ncbi:MAG: DUF4126 domain-containing protein [Leptolyngbyaceae cyanobacterium]
MVELLTALSLSAAAGFRIALPLLAIGLLRGDALWQDLPLLSQFPPHLLLGTLMGWSLYEVLFSKWLIGQRILHQVQLLLSPMVGAIAALTALYVASSYVSEIEVVKLWLIGGVGALLALVLQLVQVAWFYRLRGLPLWSLLLQDTLSLILVFSAFDAPYEGGIIALLLLFLAIRSSTLWRRLQHRAVPQVLCTCEDRSQSSVAQRQHLDDCEAAIK